MLLSLLLLVGFGMIWLYSDTTSATYGSQLEQYIVRHNPRDTADVERLTKEFDIKSKANFL